MANNSIFSGSQLASYGKLPNALPPTFGKRRVLIWSGDKASGEANNSFTVAMSEPLNQVVYAEWVSCSIPGYCFEIKQFPNLGRTSSRVGFTQYWRFIASLTNAANYTTQPFPDSQWNPTSLSRLSVTVLNPDGTVPTLASNWTMEIDM